MAFREFQVHEIRVVLRLRLRVRGSALWSGWPGWTARPSGRYVAAAQACGLIAVGARSS